MMLKITVPFREKKEVIPLIEAGADELYCGYLSSEWTKKYTNLEFERKGSGSNFKNLEELKKSVDLAHQRNIPVFLTLNGLYVNAQYLLLIKIIRELEKIDFDAFIVADLGLLLTLKKLNTTKQIHISTGGTVFNSAAVDFYRNFAVSRIVLDRQITLKSMNTISKENPDIDFEVFILNTLCVYIDGFCTFLHTYGKEKTEKIRQKEWQKDDKLHIITAYDPQAFADACRLKYSVRTFNSKTQRIKLNNIRPTFYKQLVDGIECGACALYDINQTKIKAIKIVGRQLDPNTRLNSTKFVSSVLGILEENKEIKRYDFMLRVQKLYQKIFEYKNQCRGNNCYHPEVLSKDYKGT